MEISSPLIAELIKLISAAADKADHNLYYQSAYTVTNMQFQIQFQHQSERKRQQKSHCPNLRSHLQSHSIGFPQKRKIAQHTLQQCTTKIKQFPSLLKAETT